MLKVQIFARGDRVVHVNGSAATVILARQTTPNVVRVEWDDGDVSDVPATELAFELGYE